MPREGRRASEFDILFCRSTGGRCQLQAAGASRSFLPVSTTLSGAGPSPRRSLQPQPPPPLKGSGKAIRSTIPTGCNTIIVVCGLTIFRGWQALRHVEARSVLLQSLTGEVQAHEGVASGQWSGIVLGAGTGYLAVAAAAAGAASVLACEENDGVSLTSPAVRIATEEHVIRGF